MKVTQAIKKELDVAFSRNGQPIWFRLTKYLLVLGTLYFFGNEPLFWLLLAVAAVLSVILHFWYRHKTVGWTKSYGYWKPKVGTSDGSS